MPLPAASSRPATTSGTRGPRRPTIRPEIGAATTIIRAIGTVASPASSGEKPRAPCRNSVFRNRKPPKAAKAATEITVAEANGTERKNRGSISGSRRPAS